MKGILLLLILSPLFVLCQNGIRKINIGDFSEPIRQVIGDLNNDGLLDSISVSMDLTDETRPLKFEVFFLQSNQNHELIVSTTKLIEAQYPVEKNGEFNGRQIPSFNIKNGYLEMISDIYSGQSNHKFKYQNGNFELIHFSKVVWDGNETTTETSFDLISGKYVRQSQLLGSDEYFDVLKKEITIENLPKLDNLTPFQNKYY